MRLLFLIFLSVFSNAEAKTFKLTTLFSDAGDVGVANCVVEAVLNDPATKNLKYIKVPTKNNVMSTIISARSAIANDVDIIIGGTTSQHALAIAEELKGRKIPIFFPLATHEDITKLYPFGLRTLSSSKEIARKMSQMIMDKTSAKKIVIVKNISQPWSSNYAEKVEKIIQRNHPKVEIKSLEILKGFKNYTVLAKKVENESPDAVYVPLYGLEFSLLLQALAKDKKPLIIFGQGAILNSLSEVTAISQRNPQLDIYFNTIWDHKSTGPYGKEFDKIMSNNCKQYKKDYRAASVFDAVKLIQLVMQKSKKINGQRDLFNKLKIYNYTGVLGPLKFDDQNNAIRSTVFSKLSKGQQSTVSLEDAQ